MSSCYRRRTLATPSEEIDHYRPCMGYRAKRTGIDHIFSPESLHIKPMVHNSRKLKPNAPSQRNEPTTSRTPIVLPHTPLRREIPPDLPHS